MNVWAGDSVGKAVDGEHTSRVINTTVNNLEIHMDFNTT